ncbi:MAG: YCF48-related protein [Parvibaculum sp.]
MTLHSFRRGLRARLSLSTAGVMGACAAGLLLAATLVPQVRAEVVTGASTTGDIAYAVPSALASKSLLLDSAHAGSRIVAVGEFGHIIMSDDDGKTWVQAEKVPTQATLTSVVFVDDKLGYAGGHDTTILRTEDAGKTWKLVFHDPESETPIMSVWFENADHGFAMGAFSFVIETKDGGTTWEQRPLTEGDTDDFHLNKVFSDKDGEIYVAAEFGIVYHSTDHGVTFEKIQTPYEGSFWGGVSLNDGSILVFGMRGNVFRSTDKGITWTKSETDSEQSVTGGTQLSNGTVVVTGLQGYLGFSTDEGKTFKAVTLADRLSYTSIAEAGPDSIAVFGDSGARVTPNNAAAAQEAVGSKLAATGS